MPSSRPSPSHRRGAAVRQAVLDATAELLDAEGLSGTRVVDIAARAGVHETSIYRRWGTRTNLILDAVMSRSDANMPLPDTGSTREDLTLLVTALAAFLSTPAGRDMARLGLLPADDAAQADELRTRFWEARGGQDEAIVQRGIDRGDLHPDTVPELVLEVLGGALHLHILHRNLPVDRDYISRLVDFVLTGAGPPPPEAAAEPGR
ncbi:TetR/AcrR family transcriptional regulator [Streptomyces sp. NPDC019531]|uniref:TetR/AcrR family transcriptional regulator n=1 Tax=Streptomyces sp. NPDC019531 TaxID=3365062 RepID=UPI00384A4C13